MDPMKAVDRSWPVLRRMMGLHTVAYRATHGLVGHRFPGVPPFLLLNHMGAKSGIERTAPLVYIADGDDIVLVASKGGHPKNPAWYYNLKAHPDVTVQVGSEVLPVRAREATDAERGRLWSMAVRTYRGYAGYRERTDRKIPLIVLEPRAE